MLHSANSGPPKKKTTKNGAQCSELNTTNWIDLILRDELSHLEERKNERKRTLIEKKMTGKGDKER